MHIFHIFKQRKIAISNMRIVIILAVQQLLQQLITTRFDWCWRLCSLLNGCWGHFRRGWCWLSGSEASSWCYGFISIPVVSLLTIAAGFYCSRSFCRLLDWSRSHFHWSGCWLSGSEASSWCYRFVSIPVIPLLPVTAGFYWSRSFCCLLDRSGGRFDRSRFWSSGISSSWCYRFVSIPVIPLLPVTAGFYWSRSFCCLLDRSGGRFDRSRFWSSGISSSWCYRFVSIPVIPLLPVTAGFYWSRSFCCLLDRSGGRFDRSRFWSSGISSSWCYRFVSIPVIPLLPVTAGFYWSRSFCCLLDRSGGRFDRSRFWSSGISSSWCYRFVSIPVIPLLPVTAGFYWSRSFCCLLDRSGGRFDRSRFWSSGISSSWCYRFVSIPVIPLLPVTAGFYWSRSFCCLLDRSGGRFDRSRFWSSGISSSWCYRFVSIPVIPLLPVTAGFYWSRSFCCLLDRSGGRFDRSRFWSSGISSSWCYRFVSIPVIPLLPVTAGFYWSRSFCCLLDRSGGRFDRSRFWSSGISSSWCYRFVSIPVIPLLPVTAGFYWSRSFCCLLDRSGGRFDRSRFWSSGISSSWCYRFVSIPVIPLLPVTAGFYWSRSFCCLLDRSGGRFDRSRFWCSRISCSWSYRFVSVLVIPLLPVAAGFYWSRGFCCLLDRSRGRFDRSRFWSSGISCSWSYSSRISCSWSYRFVSVLVIPLLPVAAGFYWSRGFCCLLDRSRGRFDRSRFWSSGISCSWSYSSRISCSWSYRFVSVLVIPLLPVAAGFYWSRGFCCLLDRSRGRFDRSRFWSSGISCSWSYSSRISCSWSYRFVSVLVIPLLPVAAGFYWSRGFCCLLDRSRGRFDRSRFWSSGISCSWSYSSRISCSWSYRFVSVLVIPLLPVAAGFYWSRGFCCLLDRSRGRFDRSRFWSSGISCSWSYSSRISCSWSYRFVSVLVIPLLPVAAGFYWSRGFCCLLDRSRGRFDRSRFWSSGISCSWSYSSRISCSWSYRFVSVLVIPLLPVAAGFYWSRGFCCLLDRSRGRFDRSRFWSSGISCSWSYSSRISCSWSYRFVSVLVIPLLPVAAGFYWSRGFCCLLDRSRGRFDRSRFWSSGISCSWSYSSRISCSWSYRFVSVLVIPLLPVAAGFYWSRGFCCLLDRSRGRFDRSRFWSSGISCSWSYSSRISCSWSYRFVSVLVIPLLPVAAGFYWSRGFCCLLDRSRGRFDRSRFWSSGISCSWSYSSRISCSWSYRFVSVLVIPLLPVAAGFYWSRGFCCLLDRSRGRFDRSRFWSSGISCSWSYSSRISCSWSYRFVSVLVIPLLPVAAGFYWSRGFCCLLDRSRGRFDRSRFWSSGISCSWSYSSRISCSWSYRFVSVLVIPLLPVAAGFYWSRGFCCLLDRSRGRFDRSRFWSSGISCSWSYSSRISCSWSYRFVSVLVIPLLPVAAGFYWSRGFCCLLDRSRGRFDRSRFWSSGISCSWSYSSRISCSWSYRFVSVLVIPLLPVAAGFYWSRGFCCLLDRSRGRFDRSRFWSSGISCSWSYSSRISCSWSYRFVSVLVIPLLPVAAGFYWSRGFCCLLDRSRGRFDRSRFWSSGISCSWSYSSRISCSWSYRFVSVLVIPLLPVAAGFYWSRGFCCLLDRSRGRFDRSRFWSSGISCSWSYSSRISCSWSYRFVSVLVIPLLPVAAGFYWSRGFCCLLDRSRGRFDRSRFWSSGISCSWSYSSRISCSWSYRFVSVLVIPLLPVAAGFYWSRGFCCLLDRSRGRFDRSRFWSSGISCSWSYSSRISCSWSYRFVSVLVIPLLPVAAGFYWSRGFCCLLDRSRGRFDRSRFWSSGISCSWSYRFVSISIVPLGN
ncbi:hypothetical protein Tcan_16100 [Toxocara canis]|uniref:Uncharacterized protein n=1 Tax=Toxocara canis TaxID=6265 RepID=A0A0B2V0C6_TOXCA|nr:hypothetical protein Tcan_16100 [Toxocara canis]